MRYLILLALVMLLSCNSLPISKIELGGNLQEKTGSIAITLDAAQTEIEGVPVLSESRKDGTERKLYTITEGDMQAILKKLKEKTASVMSAEYTLYQYFLQEGRK